MDKRSGFHVNSIFACNASCGSTEGFANMLSVDMYGNIQCSFTAQIF